MKWDFRKTLGIAAASALGVLGVSVLAGWIRLDRAPSLRTLFGVVLLLYAVYRLAVLRWRPRRRRPPGGLRLLALGPVLALSGLSACGGGGKPAEETVLSGSIQIAVSESHAALMRAEAAQFKKSYPDADIRVLSVPTREALVHLLNDSVRCTVTDRPFNAEEDSVAAASEAVYDSVLIATDGLAAVVNLFNDLDLIAPETLKDIFLGRIRDWSQVPGSGLRGPIETVLTGANSGLRELAASRFGLIPPSFAPARGARDQNEVVRTVATRLGALGLVSQACLRDTSALAVEKQKVRALDLLGADSTGARIRLKLHQANIYLGKYPLRYPVVMYVCSAKSRLAVGFSGFVASSPGQQVVLNWGLVPATTPVRLVQLTSGSPE
jgi:phosphate transport system substrate-binding protein